MRVLLEAGASLAAKDRWGSTPFDDALRRPGNGPLMELLEEHERALAVQSVCSRRQSMMMLGASAASSARARAAAASAAAAPHASGTGGRPSAVLGGLSRKKDRLGSSGNVSALVLDSPVMRPASGTALLQAAAAAGAEAQAAAGGPGGGGIASLARVRLSRMAASRAQKASQQQRSRLQSVGAEADESGGGGGGSSSASSRKRGGGTDGAGAEAVPDSPVMSPHMGLRFTV